MLNLLTDLPQNLPEELTAVLQEGTGVRVERIISTGHSSPEGFWYDQPENEWVIVLQGAARLQFEDRVVELLPGDTLNIRPTRSTGSSGPAPTSRPCGWRFFIGEMASQPRSPSPPSAAKSLL